MSAVPIDIIEVGEEAKSFLQSFKTLELATADSNGISNASYAPFVLDDKNNFLVYVSELSAHTANLQSNKQCSVLLIEPEAEAAHLFARKRMTFACKVESMQRDSDEFEAVMELMLQRFGDFINFMKKMKDFHAFRLCPEHATYVRGFAQAYEFEDADLDKIRHINDKGHKNSD